MPWFKTKIGIGSSFHLYSGILKMEINFLLCECIGRPWVTNQIGFKISSVILPLFCTDTEGWGIYLIQKSQICNFAKPEEIEFSVTTLIRTRYVPVNEILPQNHMVPFCQETHKSRASDTMTSVCAAARIARIAHCARASVVAVGVF